MTMMTPTLLVGDGALVEAIAAVAAEDQAGSAMKRAESLASALRALDGIGTVISCLEVVNGALLDGNVTQPVALAHAARGAGVERLVAVGSLSVFGDTPLITPTSRYRPKTRYGRSRARGEAALLDLAAPDFAVLVVRLPFLFDVERPGALGALIKLIARLRVAPVSVGGDPIMRSMMTYRAAARALLTLAAGGQRGALTIADPEPVDFGCLAAAIGAAEGCKIRSVAAPRTLDAAARVLVPELARRLLASSRVEGIVGELEIRENESVAQELARLIEAIARPRRPVDRLR